MRLFSTLLAASNAFLPTPDAFIQDKAKHCASALVAQGCAALANVEGATEIQLYQLSDLVGADLDDDEVKHMLFHDLGLPETSAVSCAALCAAEVERNSPGLPWTAETGCVDGDHDVVTCDVDLSFDHLKDLSFGDGINKANDVEQPAEEHSARIDDEPVEVRQARVEKMLLRAFRSFPFSRSTFTYAPEDAPRSAELPQMMSKQHETPLEARVATATEAFLQKTPVKGSSFLQAKQASSAWSVACVHHENFKQRSGLCPSFVDATEVYESLTGSSTAHASFAEVQTGCPATCALMAGQSTGPEGCESCASFLQTESSLQKAKIWNWLFGSSEPEQPPAPEKDDDDGDEADLPQPQWRRDVAKVSLKAQAYLETVLGNLAAGHYTRDLDVWFGRRRPSSSRQEVLRVLRSVSDMIDNVEYVYPGPQCSPNTYAYVYPRAGRGYTFDQKTGRKFNFFLCPYYMKVGLGEQIETLTHEGSHHRTAYTDDVADPDYPDQKAYGRSTCRRLAERNPYSALKNADSYCYFINDAAGHR
jgi:hypothetical protein